jgi:hypothetical protein
MSEERKQKETAGMHWEVAARQIATARAMLDLGRDFDSERSRIYKELLDLERQITDQAESLRNEAYSLRP